MISRYNLKNSGTQGAGQAVISNRDNALALATIVRAIDTLWAHPILLPAGFATTMSLEVTTGGGAGNRTHVGLFSNKRGDILYPDRLLVEAIAINTETPTGLKNSTINLNMDEGLYWLVLWSGAGTEATFRSVAVGGLPVLLGENATPVAITGITKALTYVATGFAVNLTDNTFPTGGAYSVLGVPLMWMTYSK
jgi:hypothetical protein